MTVGPRISHEYVLDDAYRLIGVTATDHIDPENPVILRSVDYLMDGVGNRQQVSGGPDGAANFGDIQAIVLRFQGSDLIPLTWADLSPETPNRTANFQDVQQDVFAFQGANYGFSQPLDCIVATAPSGQQPQASIAYDFANRMVEYNDAARGMRHVFAYDALGRRIATIVDADGAATQTRYIYAGWQVCEEQNGAGALLASYVHGLYIDEVLTMNRGGVDYYFHRDDLFNVVAVTDEMGNVVERYDYDDFGAPMFFNALGSRPPLSAIGNPLLFTGRRYDPETGWYYDRNRYLDAAAGRFTSRDPSGVWGDERNQGGAQSYVGNNPWTLVDPLGLIANNALSRTAVAQVAGVDHPHGQVPTDDCADLRNSDVFEYVRMRLDRRYGHTMWTFALTWPESQEYVETVVLHRFGITQWDIVRENWRCLYDPFMPVDKPLGQSEEEQNTPSSGPIRGGLGGPS